jgi:hypothetical protein
MASKNYSVLSAALDEAASINDFVEEVAKHVETESRYICIIKNDILVRLVLFGNVYTKPLVTLILTKIQQKGWGDKLQEVRLVATKCEESIVKELKNSNPSMKVHWISTEAWEDRDEDSINPAIVGNELSPSNP